MPHDRNPLRRTRSNVRGPCLLISLIFGLSACSTSYSISGVPPPSQELDISSYEVEFDLIQTSRLTKEQVEKTETSLIHPIEDQCSTPAYKLLDEASDRATALIKSNLALKAVDQFFADLEVIDKSARACMLQLGVTGAPYIVTVGRGRMTMPAYAAAVREFAHQSAGNNTESRPILFYLPAGGCGSRGGPGYRLANGKCASWNQ